MTKFEMINLPRGPLERMIAAGIRLEDVKFVDLYTEFMRLRGEGAKVTYAVATLAQRYGICERKTYELVRRLGSDCTERAVESETDGQAPTQI